MKKQLILGALLATALLGSGSVWSETADDVDCSGCITGDEIAKKAITNSKIKSGAVSNSKIKNNAVSSSKIKNNAVSTDKIKDGAVTPGKLSDEVGAVINDNALRIEALEYYENNSPPVLELNITPINAIVGETVSINGELNDIVEFSFRRFDTDEIYVLEFPNDGTRTVRAQLLSIPLPHLKYSFAVNGFEGAMDQSFEARTSAFQGYTEQSQTLYDSIWILVGPETLLTITWMRSLDFVYGGPLPSNATKSEIESAMSGSLDYLPYLEIRPAI